MSVEEASYERQSSTLQVSIVGVGGAGNNLLSHAITEGVSPRNCVAVGRSLNQLSLSEARNKVLLAETVPAAEDSGERVNSVQVLAHRVSPLTRGSDFTILLTGLGGVTGTSAAPTIAQLNRTNVRPVVSVVALPFVHERIKRFVALRGLKRMVESCNCTIVVDNAMRLRNTTGSDREADALAGLTVRALSQVISAGGPNAARNILNILSLGQVATACTAIVKSGRNIQTAVVDALQTPSANLPVSGVKGAIIVSYGTGNLTPLDARHAYEAIVSIVGHEVKFVHAAVRDESFPHLLILLSGYSYGDALSGFVDLIEDLYDLEYGYDSGCAQVSLPTSLYQMETF